MTTKEYVELCEKYPEYDKYEGWEKDLEAIKEFNRELLKKYPWLTPHNNWSGKKITDCAGPNGEEGFWPRSPDEHPDYDYEYTWLDDMPGGWRIAFGDQMVEEIHQELVKYNFVNDYKITQIKEKWGGLRWYDGGTPIGKLSEEYKDIIWKPSEHEGKWQPEYDFKTEVLRDVKVDHHISFFDEKASGLSSKEIEEYNKDAIYYYRLYKIIERCKVPEIINKYEKLSYDTCIDCGKPAKWMSKGWISPYCDECAHKGMKEMKKESKIEDCFEKIEEIKNEMS